MQKTRPGRNTNSLMDTLDFSNCLISHGFTGGLSTFAMISEHTMKLKPAHLHETREKTVQRTWYGLDRVAVLRVAEAWLWFGWKLQGQSFLGLESFFFGDACLHGVQAACLPSQPEGTWRQRAGHEVQ